QERIRDALESLERSASTGLLGYRLLRADGRIVWCETSAHAAPAGPDGAPAIICITRDITERIRSEEILRTASRMEATATLAAGVAHDFNNLLAGILGSAELLLEDGDYRDAATRLTQIADAAKRGGALAQQLLAYARGGRYKVEPVDLNVIVHEALHLQRHATPPRIQLEEDLDPGIAAVEADPVQLGQVITNLCINACEATPGIGRVVIRTRKVTLTAAEVATKPGLVPGPAVVLEVHDTGQGMDPPTQARIFEPFYSTKFQGRGLGLAAAYGIVKNHRGYIGVESALGHGTTFTIFLPANAGAPKQVAPAKDSYPTGTETVLLVDDDEAVLQVTRSILERLRYRVVLARNGIEAVEVARAYPGEIHLAVLDMGMPHAGGAEAFPFLRASRPSMRILISSGYEMNDVVQNLLASGANAFLQKPFRVSALATEIRAVLDGAPPSDA
ncbi:MAG: ATP-binding protein, partial [Gemmatimonadota bacterium]